MHYLREAPAEVCLIPEAYYPSRVYYAQICTVFISILDIWPLSDLSHIFGTFTIRVVTPRYKTIDLSIFGYDRICRKEPVLERGIYWVLATTEKDRRQRQLGGWKLNLSSRMFFFEIAKSLLMSLIIHTILICHGFPITPHRLGFLSAGRRAIFASDSQYTLRSLRKNMEKLLTACETTDAVGISCSSCRGSWPIMEASNWWAWPEWGHHIPSRSMS